MTVLINPPILCNKEYEESSVFTPENLLRDACRQKNIKSGKIPEICILDPDGDIVRNLIKLDRCSINPYWSCYHTKLYDFELNGITLGIVGCAVGASFAVLVAEELFVSVCQFLISISSAGKINTMAEPPYFVVIEKSLRDEGTSYHYLPPSEYCGMSESNLDVIREAFNQSSMPIYFGTTWTTDAPFRETAVAIENCQQKGISAVEMEAAALYAFAIAKKKNVVCFAHVTNEMGKDFGDFEKGVAEGSADALEVILITAKQWLSIHNPKSL